MAVAINTLKIDADASGYVSEAKAVEDANKRMADSTAKVDKSIELTERRLTTGATSLERFKKANIDGYKAQQDFSKALADLEKFKSAGLSAAEYEKSLAGIQRRYKDLTGAQNDNTAVAEKAIVSTRALDQAVKNFGFQLGDIGTSLASGASPFRVLAQQGDQVRIAFAQGGGATAVLTAFGAQLRSLVPAGAALNAVFATLAAGALALAFNAAKLDQEAKQINISLDAMHTRALANGKDFEDMVRGLQQLGISAGDARKSILEIVRTEGVNPAFAKQIIETGANIAAAFGGDAIDRAKQLNEAIAAGAEAMIKLGLEVKAFDAVQAQNLRTMALHSESAKAVNIAFQAIADTVGGKARDAMSNSTRAANDLKAAWGTLVDTLSRSTVISQLVKDLTELLNIIEKLAHNKLEWKDIFNIEGLKPTLDEIKGIGDFINRNIPDWLKGNKTPSAVAPIPPRQQQQSRVDEFYYIPNQGTNSTAYNADSAYRSAYGPAYGAMGVDELLGAVAKKISSSGEAGGQITEALVKSLIRVESGGKQSAISPAGAIGLTQLLPGTAQDMGVNPYNAQENVVGGVKYLQKLLDQFGSIDAALAAYNWGPGNYQKFLSGRLAMPSAVKAYVANVTGGAADSAGPTGATGPALDRPRESNLDAINKETEARKRARDAEKEYNENLIFQRAYQESLSTSNLQGQEKEWQAQQRGRDAVEAHNVQLQRASVFQADYNKGVLDSAAAGENEVEQQRRLAAAQGELAAKQSQAQSGAAKAQEILATASAEATGQLAKQLPVLSEQQLAVGRLVNASKEGTQQEHEAALQNQITATTHAALTAAKAADKDITTEAAKAIADKTAIQIRANDVLQQTLQVQRNINANKDRQQLVELETSLQGKQTDEIQRQIRLLQTQQDLKRRGVDLSSEIAQAELKSVDNLERANIKRNEAVQAQQRLDDAIRSAADSVVSNLGQALEDVFSGKKITDWKQKITTALSQIAAQMATGLVIKPLIGDVIRGLGFGSAAQGFGSLFGSSSDSVKANPDGSINIGTVAQIGGLAKDTGIFGDIFGSGGLKGLFSGLTNSIDSFGASVLGLSTGGLPLAGTVGPTLASGGILGSTTLSGLLGPIGLGVGVLGLLGVFDGLFGGKKPDQASAISFDLASGQSGGAQSHGVAANDQSTQAIFKSVSELTATLKQLTGGNAPGGFTISTGSRRGIVINGQIGDLKGEARFGQGDVAGATKFLELAIAHSLEGVSDTVTNVLGQVTNPDEIEGAAKFAVAYDHLKDAAADAFTEIEKDTNSVGPFAQAMSQITTAFDELRQNAEKFGLSLDPVNAGLAEATKRLQGDFNKALYEDFFNSTGRDYLNSINSIVTKTQSSIRESQAVGLGGNKGTQDIIDQSKMAAIRSVIQGLDKDKLNDVIDYYKDADSSIADLARSIRDLGDSATETTNAQKDLEEQQKAFREELNQSTLVALRESQGLGALNQIQAVFDNERDLEKKANELKIAGGGSGVDDQIGQLSHYKALSILTGLSDADFNKVKDHLSEFKDVFGDWVKEAEGMRKALSDAAKAEENYNRILEEGARIKEYLKSLAVSEQLYTSPESRFNEAATQFQDIITKAKAGDVDALSKATQYADAYIKQIESYYAGGEQGAALYKSVLDALNSLPGVDQGATDQAQATAKDLRDAADDIVQGYADKAKELIDANDAATEKAIDANNAKLDELIASNNKAAADIIAANNRAAADAKASNDNIARQQIAANDNAASRILAGSSQDAQAIGGAVFYIGGALINTNAAFSSNEIGAVYGAANSIVQAENAFANNSMSLMTYLANTQLGLDNLFTNSIINTIAYYESVAWQQIVAAIYNHSNANVYMIGQEITAQYNVSAAVIATLNAIRQDLWALQRFVIDEGNSNAGQTAAAVGQLQQAVFWLQRIAA